MLNTLQEQNKDQGPDQEQTLQFNAEVAQSREKYMQAVFDLRSPSTNSPRNNMNWPRTRK